jgi:uncharacterized protein YqhQ
MDPVFPLVSALTAVCSVLYGKRTFFSSCGSDFVFIVYLLDSLIYLLLDIYVTLRYIIHYCRKQ